MTIRDMIFDKIHHYTKDHEGVRPKYLIIDQKSYFELSAETRASQSTSQYAGLDIALLSAVTESVVEVR